MEFFCGKGVLDALEAENCDFGIRLHRSAENAERGLGRRRVESAAASEVDGRGNQRGDSSDALAALGESLRKLAHIIDGFETFFIVVHRRTRPRLYGIPEGTSRNFFLKFPFFVSK